MDNEVYALPLSVRLERMRRVLDGKPVKVLVPIWLIDVTGGLALALLIFLASSLAGLL